jgi:taurine--2-oxoglutarate transaminase
VQRACREVGMWPLIMGNRVHMVPPCVITADEVREGLAALDRALQEVQR